jgi:hypothetical protein
MVPQRRLAFFDGRLQMAVTGSSLFSPFVGRGINLSLNQADEEEDGQAGWLFDRKGTQRCVHKSRSA